MSIASRISRFVGSRSFGKAAPDTDAPSVPANLAASNIAATTLDLTWDPSTDNVGVVSYEVEQRTSAGPGAWTWLATVAHPTTTVGVTGLIEITSYDFRVRAVDLAGNMSAWAELLNVVTADETAPTMPANLAASNIAATTLDLTWDPSTDNVGVVEYEVQQRLDSGVNGDYVTVATVSAPTVTTNITGLTSATVYRFRVRAKDAAGNFSAWGPDDDGLAVTSSWNFVAPSTNGLIRAMISDGADGWYIGGSFTSITDSVATYTTGYTRLVRLRADGTIDPAFSCPVNNIINAMALDSTGLYLGGTFSGANSVGTSTRNYLARVRPFNDPSPGAVDAWNPSLSSVISDMALDSANGKLYICGLFTSIGGSGTDNNPAVTRARIARLSTGATGVVDAWNPGVGGIDVGYSFALDAANGKIYFGGNFTSIGGTGTDINPAQTRRGICRLTTGINATLDAWNPNVVASASLYVTSMLYDAVNSKLYIGGTFATIGASSGVDITPAETRNRIARLTTGTNATLDAWNPNAGGSGTIVLRIAHDTANGFIYLGGTFATIGGTARNCIARVSDGATATLDGWDPNVSIASGTARVRGILLYPIVGKAIIMGDFDAIANQVDSLGNDIAGLNL